MLDHFFLTLYYLLPWIIPTGIFCLLLLFLLEHTPIGDILINLLRRL